MNDRQTGITSKQILAAPIGSVFVWCNSKTGYPKELAHKLSRADLVVRPASWLQSRNVMGCTPPGVVVDHATRLNAEALYSLQYLRGRGVPVAF